MNDLRVTLEACVDTVQSAETAEAGGADRVELCDSLVEGGTTPSAGMMAETVARLRIPVFAIIRPRGGDYLYGSLEMAVMLRDIEVARACGVLGIVTGALSPNAAVDRDRTRALVEAAAPMPVTFHRAFDACRRPEEALETLVELGVARVLTSGQGTTAIEGSAVIRRLVERAVGRIGIIAGGGIQSDHVAKLVADTGVREVHARGAVPVPSPMMWRPDTVSLVKQVLDRDVRLVTDEAELRRMRDALQ